MAVGDEAKAAAQSYVAVGRETTFGTYASATTALEVISCSFKTTFEHMKLDEIGLNRGPARRVQMGKVVSGTLEAYLHPHDTTLLLANAMGGGITSNSTVTNINIHSITAGNFDTTTAGLSFNVRKGDTHTWRYLGGRINRLTIAGTVGEPVKVTADLVFIDSTQLTDNIATSLSYSSVNPFTYVNGVYRYAATEAAAATTTVEEPIQSFELTINNNLKTDRDARELGTVTLSVIPATRREIEMKAVQRFDTTTAYNRMTQATEGALELRFSGDLITTGSNYLATFRLPSVFVNNADTAITGAKDILMADIDYDVLVDTPSTTTGKDIGITLQNTAASY